MYENCLWVTVSDCKWLCVVVRSFHSRNHILFVLILCSNELRETFWSTAIAILVIPALKKLYDFLQALKPLQSKVNTSHMFSWRRRYNWILFQSSFTNKCLPRNFIQYLKFLFGLRATLTHYNASGKLIRKEQNYVDGRNGDRNEHVERTCINVSCGRLQKGK